MDEYITINEFCKLTGYKKQTVYNKIHRRELELGKHYVKPTRKKILFKREEIRRWLEGESVPIALNEEVGYSHSSRIEI